MEAMEYETLLRRIYNCGRNYNKGADADIYRPMERAHHNLETKTLYKTQDEREYEYRKTFSKVRGNVRDAIRTGIERIENQDSRKNLEAMMKKLTIDFYSKEELDRIIRDADDIFRENGLEMR